MEMGEKAGQHELRPGEELAGWGGKRGGNLREEEGQMVKRTRGKQKSPLSLSFLFHVLLSTLPKPNPQLPLPEPSLIPSGLGSLKPDTSRGVKVVF